MDYAPKIKSKINRPQLFLILILSLVAFLAGYIIIGGGVDIKSSSKTGTILDKFSDAPQSTVDNPQLAIEGRQPFLISNRGVVSVANSFGKDGVVYFEKNTGKLFKFDFKTNQEEVVSETVLPNFLSAQWSPVKKEVVSSFYSPTGTKFKYHSYNTGENTDLNPDIYSIAVSPDGEFIAYYAPGTDDNLIASLDEIGSSAKIMISQPNGSYPKKIINTRLNNPDLFWPTKDSIALKTEGGDLFLLTLNGNLNKLLTSKDQLSVRWSRSGKKNVYSALNISNNLRPELFIQNIETKSEIPLGVSGIASKCVWSIDDTNVFCALSSHSPQNEIFILDTSNGYRKLLAETDINIDKMYLSSTEDYLLFTDLVDNKLYGVKVSP